MPRITLPFYLTGLLLSLALVPLAAGISYFYTKSVPKVYSSSALLKMTLPDTSLNGSQLSPIDLQTEFEIIQSKMILFQAIHLLIEKEGWTFVSPSGVPLPEDEIYQQFKNRNLRVRSYRNTKLIELTVFADQPEKARNAANIIAKVYVRYSKKQPGIEKRIELVSEAEAAPYPFKPSFRLNIILGVGAGLLLGGISAIVLTLFFLFGRIRPSVPATT